MSTTLKKCSRCPATKPLTAFNRDSRRPDGRRYECADCTRKDQTRSRGGYVSPARQFVASYGATIDSFAAIDKALDRTPPPRRRRRTAPADLAVGRVVAVTDTLLAGLLGGDETARAEAERILGGGR